MNSETCDCCGNKSDFLVDYFILICQTCKNKLMDKKNGVQHVYTRSDYQPENVGRDLW
jgi:hypothetical protein